MSGVALLNFMSSLVTVRVFRTASTCFCSLHDATEPFSSPALETNSTLLEGTRVFISGLLNRRLTENIGRARIGWTVEILSLAARNLGQDIRGVGVTLSLALALKL